MVALTALPSGGASASPCPQPPPSAQGPTSSACPPSSPKPPSFQTFPPLGGRAVVGSSWGFFFGCGGGGGGCTSCLLLPILIAEFLAPPYLSHPGMCLTLLSLGQVLVGLPPREAKENHCTQVDCHSRLQVGLGGGLGWQ